MQNNSILNLGGIFRTITHSISANSDFEFEKIRKMYKKWNTSIYFPRVLIVLILKY